MTSIRKPPQLSIILPVYLENNSVLLKSTGELVRYLNSRHISFEIFLSINGTMHNQSAHDLSITSSRVKIIKDEKKGLGLAIKNAVKKVRGDYCYITSVDIPYAFSDLEQMLHLLNQYDIIVGSKLHSKSIYKIQKIRILFSYFFFYLRKILLPSYIVKDPNGSIFGKTKLIKKYSAIIEDDDYFFSTKLVYSFLLHNLKIIEVPVIYKKNVNSSTLRLKDGVYSLYRLIIFCLRERYRKFS